MTRPLGAKNRALADQVVAMLRGADGFPMSTGEIARTLGDRLVSFSFGKPPLSPRPPCWTADTIDPEVNDRAHCERCRSAHRQPVWRTYDAQDVRGILNGLAKRGEVEKVVLDGARVHYWRRDDSDCEIPA